MVDMEEELEDLEDSVVVMDGDTDRQDGLSTCIYLS